MIRKTNLINRANIDEAEFVTFSNYTEAMTGNMLSVKTKMYPSMFLCLNMESANTSDNRHNIKDLLTAYYENKLAYLRDYFKDNEGKYEEKCHPLYYLLYLLNIIECNYDGTDISIPEIMTADESRLNIVYASEITEQNYNGAFSDIIFNVNSSNITVPKIKFTRFEDNKITSVNTSIQKNKTSEAINTTFDTGKIYGWCNKKTDAEGNTLWEWMGPAAYDGMRPYYDTSKLDKILYDYNVDNYIGKDRDGNTDFIEVDSLVSQKPDTLEFNVVIPLFDVVNADGVNDIYKNNREYVDVNYGLNNADGISRVPMGIYFTGEPVVLSTKKGVSPTWSLSLATQFAPFLYGRYSNPTALDKTVTADTYTSFSHTLVKQNQMIDRFQKMEQQISSIAADLRDLEHTVRSNIELNGIKTDSKDVSFVSLQRLVDLENEVSKLKKELNK